MSSVPSFIKIFGTLYSCVLRYVSVKDLDPLARFMLEAIRSEPRIEVLTRSFGLPPRLIEDILAELIRRNFAVLDVDGSRIKALDKAPILYEYGEGQIVEIWQDHVTGMVVPADLVRTYKESHDAPVLKAPENFVPQSVLDLPDAQLIAMLVRTDPSLGLGENSDWRLDRLLHRFRIDGMPIYVPVEKVTVKEREFTFIRAPDLPMWMTRSWTVALQRAEGHAESDERLVAMLDAAGPHRLEGIPEPLDHCRLTRHVTRWGQAALESLSQEPPPTAVYEIRTLDHRQSMLEERLFSLCRATLEAPREGAESHLEAALAGAERVVLIALSDLGPAERQALLAAFDRSSRGAAAVHVLRGRPLDANPEDAHKLVELRKQFQERSPLRLQVTVTAAQGRGFSGAMIVMDDQEAWIACHEILASKKPTLRLRGAETIAVLQGLLQQFVPPRAEGGSWLRLRAPIQGRSLAEARFGESGPLVKDIAVELAALRRRLVEAIVDPEGALQDALAPPPSAREGANATPVTTLLQLSSKPLRQLIPALYDDLQSLISTMSEPLSAPWTATSLIEGSGHAAVPVAAVRLPDQAPGLSRLVLMSPSLGRAATSEAMVELLLTAIDHGWMVEMLWEKSEDPARDALASEIAIKLRARIPSGRLKLRRALHRLPFSALVAGDLIVAGSYPWLDETRDVARPAPFSFALHAPWLVNELLKAIVAAELAPASRV
ncbi:hypothetical protein WME88_45225 [Sorangium sp. So ce216]